MPPSGLRVELHHPAVDAVGIELRVDGAVERVGEIDAPAVAADLDHLRPAVERPVLGARMRRPRDDAADADLAGELRVERIGHVVLLQVAGAPAGDVEEAVVHRQIDVGDERRHRLEALEQRRQLILARRLGRNLDDLLHRPFVAVAVPGPDRGGEVLEADHAIDEAIGLGRVVRRTQLEDQLVFVAEVDGLQVLALVQVPEVQAAAVFRAEQDLGDEAVLERVGRAPFARDQRVVAEVPPRVIGEVLRPAIDLPVAAHVEGLVVHQEDAARRLAFAIAERRDVDALRAAMHRVRPRIAGLARRPPRARSP